MEKIGTLYGVSVGTGDPELITIKGLKIIQNTPIIAYPQGVNGRKGKAEMIVESYIQLHHQRLPLIFPYIQDEEILQQSWYLVSLQVWEHLKQGLDVVFVCEGDISFYSTFNYLSLTLKTINSDVKIEAIPGVSSPMAAASVLNIPLTMQEEKLAVLPAIYSVEDLDKVLNWADVVVLMKVASVYDLVWNILANKNLLEYSYLVEKATTKEEKIYSNLTNYPHLTVSYFSILIIRKNGNKIINSVWGC